MEAVREKFDIQKYMTGAVERIVADALKATLAVPAQTAFFVKFATASKKASIKRAKLEKNGEHVPPFLIASITSSCNLHCAGCYSRCNHATLDTAPSDQLDGDEWRGIFDEASDLGISFILLAGGEPLLRWDVIEAAGDVPDILFPIFTNGTFIGEKYLELFDKKRNLIPVLSIEGDREITDERRGAGVYDKLVNAMDALHDRNIIFGASVTVTTENIAEVTSEEFVSGLAEKGCRLIVYVEFVPVTDESTHLAPGDKERRILEEHVRTYRDDHDEIVVLSFPGDEKGTDGCIAAGRGFFHINSHGGAEPCPFSPYSDINVRETSVRDALNSGLFRALQLGDFLKDDHKGGCVLYEKRDEVENLLRAEAVNI